MERLLALSLEKLSHLLNAGEISARQLVDESLRNIETLDDPANPVFLSVYKDSARALAKNVDAARAAGKTLPAYAGIPFAVKDLFDVQGEVTTAGSVVLKDAPAAKSNALVLQRLLDAGFILIGKTNMTEFAFSGLGLNPHYGTPRAWGSTVQKPLAPGGSSSGAGVSVAAAMVPLSLGTDTAGSCRVPAAWNGVVGLKPSKRSLSCEGVYPLSPLLDVPGPLTRFVSCASIAYQLMAGQAVTPLNVGKLESMRFAITDGLPMQNLDETVEANFNRVIELLKRHGATIETITIPEFDVAATVARTAPFAAYDAYQHHKTLIETKREQYDPFVALRVELGQTIDNDTYNENKALRTNAIATFANKLLPYDALLMPTTAIATPALEPLKNDSDIFAATNGMALRNTGLINFIDGCAVSIPCQPSGQAALGLSICHTNGADSKLLSVAHVIEPLLSP